MNLEIISPESIVFKGEASNIMLPGKNGYFEILNNHAPLISLLQKGRLIFSGPDQDNTEVAKMKSMITKNDYAWLADKIIINSTTVGSEKYFVFEIAIEQGFVEVDNNKVTVLI